VYNPKHHHFSSEGYSHPSGGSSVQHRVVEMKGWYDEQPLAHFVGTSLKPLPFLGTIMPDPALDRLVKDNFKGGWIHAGSATLGAPFTYYETKLGLVAGKPPHGDAGWNLTETALCWKGLNDAAICKGVPATVEASCNWDPITDVGNKWYAQITSPDGTVKHVCVERHDHSAVVTTPIPGTARWMWLDRDETQWYRCDQGCCTLKP